MQWKAWINSGDLCHKVFFECSDASFSGVASVKVGRYQLVLHVFGGEKFFKAADASLSRVWSFGLKPLAVSSSWI
jgi:hypothetical protein